MHHSHLLDKISQSSSISPNSSYFSSPSRIKKNPRINVAPISASYMGFFKMGNMSDQHQNQPQKQIPLKQKQRKIEILQGELFTKRLVLNKVQRTFRQRENQDIRKVMVNLQKLAQCIVCLCKENIECKKQICYFLLKTGACNITGKKSNIINYLMMLLLQWIQNIFQLIQKTIKKPKK